MTTRAISSAAAGTSGSDSVAPSPHPAADDGDLLVGRRRQRQDDGVEPPPQRARQFVHAAVAVVRRGDQVEAAAGGDLGVELRHREHLLRQHRDEGVLHLGRHAGEFLHPDDRPARSRGYTGAGHECRAGGPSASSRVVPAVPQGSSVGAGGPWTSNVESPLIAAVRCSLNHVLAVPGTPSSSSARSVARVATAFSTSRCWPTYLGVMTIGSPLARSHHRARSDPSRT